MEKIYVNGIKSAFLVGTDFKVGQVILLRLIISGLP